MSSRTSPRTASSTRTKRSRRATTTTDGEAEAAPGGHRFVAAGDDPRDRLDRFVVARLGAVGVATSRAVVQRWIELGRVTIAGSAATKASVAVPEGAAVGVLPAAPPPSRALPDPSVVLDVVYEDAHLLIVDKPAGLVCHPGAGHPTGTLVNGLLARGGLAPDLFAGDDEAALLRPGLVHRLDRGTSGLLVVAKDGPTRDALQQAFARHAIERAYWALTVGVPEVTTYRTPHARHAVDRQRFTSFVEPGRPSRLAVTHVDVLERLAGAALVRCRLETGRTHQIRVHLAERAKTPILGDPVYGAPPPDARLRAVAAALGHQALHAKVLGFTHPRTGRVVRWESELPADFQRALEALRARRDG